MGSVVARFVILSEACCAQRRTRSRRTALQCTCLATLLLVAAPANAATDRYVAADAAINTAMRTYKIVGASLVIAEYGRIVHSKGFGYADLAKRTPVRPASLFALASVSKTLTAIAVMKLVQDGRLSLDAKAFDYFPQLRQPPGTKRDPRLDQVTVRDLLIHAGGWNRNKSGDPTTKLAQISASLHLTGPVTPLDMVRWLLGQPLDFDPGTQQAYSNVGYIVLGCIVQRVSEQPYADYVRMNVLAPSGVTDAALATSLGPPHAGEVRRYGPHGNPVPNGNSRAAAAAGGWIASAVDLVHVVEAFDGSSGKELLLPVTVGDMLAPPVAPLMPRANGTYFGYGWDGVTSNEYGHLRYWKDGSLLGVRTWIEHTDDGYDFAVFTTAVRGAAKVHPDSTLQRTASNARSKP